MNLAQFDFEWRKCEQCGHELMWARLPGVPDRAVHVCENPSRWIPAIAADEEYEDDE